MLGMKGWKLSKVNKDVDRLSYVSDSRSGLWDSQKAVVLEAMLARMRVTLGFPNIHLQQWSSRWIVGFTEGCCSRSYACEDEGFSGFPTTHL